MGRKVISFGLSTSEINRAMKELADYKQEILRKTELLREKVAERLADEAKSGFSGAIVDELKSCEVRLELRKRVGRQYPGCQSRNFVAEIRLDNG